MLSRHSASFQTYREPGRCVSTSLSPPLCPTVRGRTGFLSPVCESRACSCYAEAMVFFGRSPKNPVLVAIQKGGRLPSAVAFGAALLWFGSVGFEIRRLRVSGLAVRKSHFKCLYSLRSDSCVPSVASQQSWSGKSARAGPLRARGGYSV